MAVYDPSIDNSPITRVTAVDGAGNPVTILGDSSTTPTLTNVAANAASVTLFASNVNANQRIVFNESTQILYLKFGSGAASITSYTVQIASNGFFEFPIPTYTGAVTGIWAAADATGNARLTEVV